MMNSKIGNAELTGVAEGVEQKLHMDVTELVSKVILLQLFRNRKSSSTRENTLHIFQDYQLFKKI